MAEHLRKINVGGVWRLARTVGTPYHLVKCAEEPPPVCDDCGDCCYSDDCYARITWSITNKHTAGGCGAECTALAVNGTQDIPFDSIAAGSALWSGQIGDIQFDISMECADKTRWSFALADASGGCGLSLFSGQRTAGGTCNGNTWTGATPGGGDNQIGGACVDAGTGTTANVTIEIVENRCCNDGMDCVEGDQDDDGSCL